MKQKRYIYNPHKKDNAKIYKYKTYGKELTDATKVCMYTDTFALMTSIGKIKQWFAWERELDIEDITTQHIYQYAYHWELKSKYDP